jgi:antitoxin MazE
MKTRMQKRGNSLVLRIPKSLAEKVGLRPNAPFKLSVRGGALVVRPIASESPTLEVLLPGANEHNLPGEWETGPAVGRETW